MIQHPFPPLYDSESRILVLGSFPSVKSREGCFFYHHPQNRFWKVLAAVLQTNVPVSIEEKTAMLHRHHIALWDAIASCEITGPPTAVSAMSFPMICPPFSQAPIYRQFSAMETRRMPIIRNISEVVPVWTQKNSHPPVLPMPLGHWND